MRSSPSAPLPRSPIAPPPSLPRARPPPCDAAPTAGSFRHRPARPPRSLSTSRRGPPSPPQQAGNTRASFSLSSSAQGSSTTPHVALRNRVDTAERESADGLGLEGRQVGVDQAEGAQRAPRANSSTTRRRHNLRSRPSSNQCRCRGRPRAPARRRADDVRLARMPARVDHPEAAGSDGEVVDLGAAAGDRAGVKATSGQLRAASALRATAGRRQLPSNVGSGGSHLFHQHQLNQKCRPMYPDRTAPARL